MPVGSDDSESSDLTSYYCIDCDTRNELGSDALPFVCGIKYSCNDERIGNHGEIIPLSAAQLAHYQVCITFDLETGTETLAAGNTVHVRNDREQDGETSGSNTNATILVCYGMGRSAKLCPIDQGAIRTQSTSVGS
jgi:hypothetical protein